MGDSESQGKSNKGKKLFVLPNGYTLKYALTSKGKKTGDQDQWWQDEHSRIFWGRSKLPEKTLLPKLGLWSSKSNQHLVCADFDEVPPGYSSFDNLYADLQQKYGHQGVILRSPSNKVKAIFLIEKTTSTTPTDNEALDCLERIDPIFSKYSDKKGLRICFVNEQMAKILLQRIPNLPVIQRIEDKPTEKLKPTQVQLSLVQVPISVAREPKPIAFYEGSIPPNLNDFIHYYNSKSAHIRERFLRFILAKPRKALTSIDLPIAWLANNLGTSKQSISNWLAWLLKKHWLQSKSTVVKKGVQAKTYKVDGLLKDACLHLSEGSQNAGQYNPPNFIRDGEWDNQLYWAMNHFNNDWLYRKWFYSLPGHDLKDREKKMQHQLDQWKRRQKKGSFGAV